MTPGHGLLFSMLMALTSLAGAQDLSSRRDHSDNAQRHLPIACKADDLQRFPGHSMNDVFQPDWPGQPDVRDAGAHQAAELLTIPPGAADPKGLPAQAGLVVAAVLVDTNGRPLRVEPVCVTTEGYDAVVKRVLMRSRYRPALINGQPHTSVAMVVMPFKGGVN